MAFEITEARDGELVLRAELQGVDPDEVRVDVKDGVLTVAGEHREESEEEKDGVTRRQSHRTSFSRSVRVPPGIDVDQVETSFEDGKVRVRVPGPGGA